MVNLDTIWLKDDQIENYHLVVSEQIYALEIITGTRLDQSTSNLSILRLFDAIVSTSKIILHSLFNLLFKNYIITGMD